MNLKYVTNPFFGIYIWNNSLLNVYIINNESQWNSKEKIIREKIHFKSFEYFRDMGMLLLMNLNKLIFQLIFILKV